MHNSSNQDNDDWQGTSQTGDRPAIPVTPSKFATHKRVQVLDRVSVADLSVICTHFGDVEVQSQCTTRTCFPVTNCSLFGITRFSHSARSY